jgi:hypothetical protein
MLDIISSRVPFISKLIGVGAAPPTQSFILTSRLVAIVEAHLRGFWSVKGPRWAATEFFRPITQSCKSRCEAEIGYPCRTLNLTSSYRASTDGGLAEESRVAWQFRRIGEICGHNANHLKEYLTMYPCE